MSGYPCERCGAPSTRRRGTVVRPVPVPVSDPSNCYGAALAVVRAASDVDTAFYRPHTSGELASAVASLRVALDAHTAAVNADAEGGSDGTA